jgi:hypothetical protein
MHGSHLEMLGRIWAAAIAALVLVALAALLVPAA